MPYAPIIADVLEVRVYCTLGLQTAINIHHARVSAVTGGGLDQSQIADAISGDIAALMKGCMTQGALYYGVGVQKIAPGLKQSSSYSASSQGVGTSASDPLPSQVSGVIKKTTLTAGRHGHGRFYVPFPSKVYQAAGGEGPSPAYLVALANLAPKFTGGHLYVNGGNNTTINYVLWDRVHQAAIPIDNTIAQSKWGTQRRRGDYGRPNPPPF